MRSLSVLAVLLCWALLAGPAAAAEPPRVLRYAFPVAETGFDPAQVSDLYSRTVVANIFESPLTYDLLARPARLKPQTAEALPVPSDNYRTWTLRLRPGIYFADDPAFKGQRRELVAEDYVYTVKRLYDPALKSPVVSQLENARLLGLSELKRAAIKDKAPFPYEREVEGVRALDRYTLQFRLAAPAPRFDYVLADSAMIGAVAREVVEHYGPQIMAHPVGTGPFRLAAWKRSSKIVLERNPGFREQHYDERPEPGDAEGEAIARRLAGRRLPMLDRVEISIVEESQPRLLGFLNAEHDYLDRLPPELSPMAVPGGQLAPHLAKKGVQLQRVLGADIGFSYFAMENPVVGGYAPAQVALRRAIALAYDTQAENVQARKGQSVAAQSIVPPHTTGYDPRFKSEMSDQDLARAQALLDLHGWVDRNGDGWRDQPDGQPLLIEYATQPDQASRVLTEIWQRAFNVLRIRVQFKPAKWPENLKASRAGKLMMWGVAWSATTPDVSYMLDLLYGPSKGQANHARFNLPEMNELFERQAVLPDGPERLALIERIKRLGVAFMPYKINNHRLLTDLLHPWVDGYRRHPFMRETWRYMDVDPARQAAAH
ncbi:bicyclomycin resistance protein [Ideonella sp. 4Y11]|uniref:Bicyclomycin resistance protein n=1 Tax=Ideonella aquatica TaxID=2824119 RepID=A0A940YGP7_9BURK|nr:ABC transporter substrate-binding protein [Ideonella aquatica]MBQ0957846.1 bicyclomycin resistance protein [Ideonella aquatica]